MKKLPLTARQALYLLLALIALALIVFVKKAVFFIVLFGIGLATNFFLHKSKLPINLTITFFLSIFILHFYGPLAFFIFFLSTEILTRPFTGLPLPGAAYPGYIVWLALAFLSLGFTDKLVMVGVIMTVIRYFFLSFFHVLGGSTFVEALFRNSAQLILNTLLFLYVLPVMLSVVQ